MVRQLHRAILYLIVRVNTTLSQRLQVMVEARVINPSADPPSPVMTPDLARDLRAAGLPVSGL